MKRSRFFLSCCLGLALASGPALAKDNERPLMPLLSADEIGPRCDSGLSDLHQRLSAMEQSSKADAGNGRKIFAAWNDLHIALEDLQGPVGLLNNVSPDPAVRSSAEACARKINRFFTTLFQNEKIYLRFKTVVPRDAVDQKLRQDMLDNFEDTGVSLPPEQQLRMKQILDKMEKMRQEFTRNLRDNNEKLSFSPEEVQGLPEAYLARAKRDAQGNYLLGFAYPDYVPFIENADNSEARRRYQFAFLNRGSSENLALLKETVELRREIAGLFGLPSYAHYAIHRRMAHTPEAVYKFLDEVQTAVAKLEQKELEELRVYKAETLKQPLAETRLERWDVAYWQQRLKKARHAIDQTALRKYFPTDAALPWALSISGDLYGVSFKKIAVPVWHDSVEYFDVLDKQSGKRIAGIYLDPYPREGKYGHAAAFAVRGVSTLAKRTPISVLVTNFDRKGLDGAELETLVHEFGHVLHGVLSSTRYVTHAGTSVERDFVEAPSQMYEEWARRKESLSLLSTFCKTPCPTVDDDLLTRLTAAHNQGRAIRYARQLLYASFDMSLYGETPADPLATWNKMESLTPLGHVEGTEFPGQFGHVMGGYAAGYYGYMWSEVLALDMLSRYQGKLMNPQTGRLYRKAILSRGSELRGSDMVRAFLGREPNSKAFFDEISGKRLH